MINTTVLTGRLTKDVDIRESNSGKLFGKANIAVNTGFGDNKKTCFVPLTIFGNVVNHLNKGDLIGVEGRLDTYDYEKDGNKIYGWGVIVNNVTFLNGSSKSNNTEKSGFPNNHEIEDDEIHEIEDDEIPF